MPRLALVGGGTGFIGRNIGDRLKKLGYQVLNISRSSGSGKITWESIERSGLPENTHAIVQVSGENVLARPWTESRKKVLLDSRVHTTKILSTAIAQAKVPPKVFVSGSAVGIYPSSPSLTLNENSTFPPPQNFAAELCREWEKSSEFPANVKGVRRAIVRTGVVLGKGGALPQLALPFKFGIGGPTGSGHQWFPWISEADIANLFVHAVENQNVEGVLNGVAPGIVTSAEFAKILGEVLHRPSFVRLPEFVVKAIFGDRAFMLLEGSKIIPQHTLESGFKFQHPDLESALRVALDK